MATVKQSNQKWNLQNEGNVATQDREVGELSSSGQVEDTAELSGADGSGAVEGEGSYEAAREYGRGVREFVHSGRVEEAAEEAAHSLDEDEEGLREAEQIGKSHAQGWEGASQASGNSSSPGLDQLDPEARHRALERINQLMEEGYSERQAQRIALRLAEDWAEMGQASDDTAVHVVHERNGWAIHSKDESLDAVFDRIDDALRRAHEIAVQLHVPLHVHGPDGELIDRFDA